MAQTPKKVGTSREDSQGPNGKESKPAMNLEKAKHQKPAQQAELPLEARGETPHGQRSGAARPAMQGDGGSGTTALMERVVDNRNVKRLAK